MNYIIFVSMLAAVNYASSKEDKLFICNKMKLHESNKACLNKYIKHVLPERATTSRKPETTTTPTTTSAPEPITRGNITVKATTSRKPETTTTPTTTSAPEPMTRGNITVKATTSTKPETTKTPTTSEEESESVGFIPEKANTSTKPETSAPESKSEGSIPEYNCLTEENVKKNFSNNWENFYTLNSRKNFSSNYLKVLHIGQDIRLGLFDKVFQQSKLEEFKSIDLDCIKNMTRAVKNECILKNLKVKDEKQLLLKISHTMSRYTHYDLRKEKCELSQTLTGCVKRVLKGCPKAIKIVTDIESNVTIPRCQDFLNPPPTVSKHKGLPTVATVFIVIACICGTAAAVYAVLKYLKIRRSRGHLTVNKTNSEECEMTTRSRPTN